MSTRSVKPFPYTTLVRFCGPSPRGAAGRVKRAGAHRGARALPYVYSRLDRGAPSLSSHNATWPVKRPRGGGFGEPGAIRSHGASRMLPQRSEEHTSELQSLMRISYAVFCLKKKKIYIHTCQQTTRRLLM